MVIHAQCPSCGALIQRRPGGGGLNSIITQASTQAGCIPIGIVRCAPSLHTQKHKLEPRTHDGAENVANQG